MTKWKSYHSAGEGKGKARQSLSSVDSSMPFGIQFKFVLSN